VFSGRMLQVYLSGYCICFTHTLYVFYLDVAYDCNGSSVLRFFSSDSEACSECFNCLQTYVSIVIFECFKNRSGVASLLPTFCCIVLCVLLPAPAGHSYNAAARSFRIGGATPFPLLSLGQHGPRVERAKRSAACGVRPDVRALALPTQICSRRIICFVCDLDVVCST